MTERKKTISANLTEQIAIRDVLAERLHLVEGQFDHKDRQIYRYEDGWSDEMVAKAVDERLGQSHGYYVRMSQFGPIKRRQMPRLVALDERFQAVTKRITIVEHQLRRMIKYFGVTNADDIAMIIGNVDSNEETTNGQIK